MALRPTGLVVRDKPQVMRRSGPAAAAPRRLYGVDVPAMSFQLHEWDIHIVCCGTDDASGASGTAAADDPLRQAGNVRR
jgi:hypothetical protein